MVSTLALFLGLLSVRLSIVHGVICNDDQSLDRDVFEEHGCSCGISLVTVNAGNLFHLYRQAYDDCFEDDVRDNYTIDCSFTTQGNDQQHFTRVTGRSLLGTLPVGAGDVYQNITCL